MERKTKQRRIIQEVFKKEARPLNPSEVHTLARQQLPTIGIATVYRTIRDLEREGKITSVDIPNKGLYYEASRTEHHHHFHCRVCQRIYEIECTLPTEAQVLRNGFYVEDHEVVYHGVCAACRGRVESERR